MQEPIPDGQGLPEFDVAFQYSSPFFYFHHIIDPVEATLRVEVIGPNLTYTFRHERIRERLSPSSVLDYLERKTTGFLALVTDGGKRRIVLTWAESGHGVSRFGDLLDVGPSVLANNLWTKRVIAMGKLFGIGMHRPWDGRASKTAGCDMTGAFLGAHVEVKLAVHAIFVLLSTFNITQDLNKVSRRHLRMLRHARWEDGTIPEFEIYFSRKNCNFCGSLVRKLASITGVSIKLIWRDRLVKMVYKKRTMNQKAQTNQPRTQQESNEQDEYEAENDGTLFEDDVELVDCVDLTGDQSCQLPISGDDELAEIINLIDEDEEIVIDDDTNPSRSPSPSPKDQMQQRLGKDGYIDGLAYCVGQIDQCPQGAQTAIIEFAETMSKQRSRSTRRAPAPKNHQAWASVNKPLPATAEMEPPAWMTAKPAAPAGASQAVPDPAKKPTGAQEMAPVKEQPEGKLPTPPASETKQQAQHQRTRSPERHDRDRSKSPSEIQHRRRKSDTPSSQIRQRSPRRYFFSGGEKTATSEAAGRARTSFIRVEIPARRRASPSPSPDPF